jgi:hypothetical protein
MIIDIPHLLKLSQAQLDELFLTSPAGEIPIGDTEGAAIILPGTFVKPVMVKIARWFFWQGKVFDPVKGELLNKILPFGLKAIPAKVYKDKSWMDGKECITLDYSGSIVGFRSIRDEIRLVSPGIYLGVVFVGKTRLIGFALKLPD